MAILLEANRIAGRDSKAKDRMIAFMAGYLNEELHPSMTGNPELVAAFKRGCRVHDLEVEATIYVIH
jgi:hypothetical protein